MLLSHSGSFKTTVQPNAAVSTGRCWDSRTLAGGTPRLHRRFGRRWRALPLRAPLLWNGGLSRGEAPGLTGGLVPWGTAGRGHLLLWRGLVSGVIETGLRRDEGHGFVTLVAPSKISPFRTEPMCVCVLFLGQRLPYWG